MTKSRANALLRLHLTSGIDVMTLMPVVSELLKELIPSFSLSMIRVDETCAPREHYSEYFDEASHELFARAGAQFSARSSDPAAFSNLLRNRRAVGTLIDTRPDYVAGATYQHLFKRNGIHHCLDIAMRDGTGPIGILGIFREERTQKFTRSEVVIADGLYHHLVHACAQRAIGTEFDEIETALVVVDLRGKIVWASRDGRRWLEDVAMGAERAPLVEAGLIPAACAELVRSFVRSRTTSSRASGAGRVPTTVLPIPGGRLRLRAYPLEGAGRCDYIGIQMGLEMDRGLRVLRALERAALSPQQCRLALAQWQSRPRSEIRSLLGVTANTLKSYQKDMYSRLAVGSAAELRELLDDQARAVSLDLVRHRPRAA
ncbi:MAG: hypothetical protein KIT84_44660 [Labilithrix sp.]|nr:hypothetical protein [Labilithrix sp.]MCW5818173.1 hypothetical protein [Labilithrix sp.]